MTAGRKKIAILLSGRGSNMLAIADSVAHGCLSGVAEVGIVISNVVDAPGITKAAARGLKTATIPSQGRSREAFEEELTRCLEDAQPDLIVLAGFMRILSPLFVRDFEGRIVNIHPADTREHQGLGGYAWAWEQRLPRTMVTVHHVDVGLDTGEIIAQQEVDLRGCESLEEVERRGLAAEHVLYPEALKELLATEPIRR